MESYYDISLQLRYYGRLPQSTRIESGSVWGELGNGTVDVLRWKEPPHEYLANILRNERAFCGPKSVEAFVRRYGPLIGRTGVTSSSFIESCITFTAYQETIRKAWHSDREALLEIEAQLEILDVVSTRMESGCFVLTTINLWTFICFFFMRDFSAGKTKVCKSPDCTNPFFLEQRKGQIYCTHVCAVRENVRRFRRAEAQERRPQVSRQSGTRRRRNGAIKTG